MSAAMLSSPARDMPLERMQLIEASAGTGKTWSLVVLYARFVLERGLPVSEVLATTFTRAATAELRARVRSVFAALSAQLSGSTPLEELDTAAQAVLAACERSGVTPGVLRHRALLAQTSLDEAPILTMHGFYQRTLAEQALASGDLLEAELTQDTHAELLLMAQDFWREHIAGLGQHNSARGTDALSRAEKTFATPHKLARWTSRVLAQGEPRLRVAAHVRDAELVSSRWHQCVDLAEQAAQSCRQALALGTVEAVLQDAIERGTLKRDTYKANVVPARFRLLDSWLQGDPLKPDGWLKLVELLGASGIAQQRQDDRPITHPLFECVDTAYAAQQALDDATADMVISLKLQWLIQVREQLPKRLAAQGLRATDQLAPQLCRLLESERGSALRRALRHRYRAVLVDEFQDTDAAQWQVIHQLFAGTEVAVVLVGDPKQAIYRFRGADLDAYLQARASVHETHCLVENYRGTPALVDAQNAIFEVELQSAETTGLFGDAGIGYPHVVSAGVPAPLIGMRTTAGIEVLLLDQSSAKRQADLIDTAATAAAAWIASLLNHGPKLGGRALLAEDIAVLVRTNEQGLLMRRALMRAGVNAAMRPRLSVYASFEAQQLLWLLDALSDPSDRAAVRRAYACALLGRTTSDLLHMAESVDAWADAVVQLRRWQQLAQQRGVMACLMQVMVDAEVAQRWAQLPDGERRLVNLRHLIELLADAKLPAHDLAALRNYLSQSMGTWEQPDSTLLRLESEDRAVKVMTIHGSKGLQFPVVVLPFQWLSKTKGSDTIRLTVEGNHRVLDLGPSAMSDSAAGEGEDARLNYVALTRAQNLCVVLDVMPDTSATANDTAAASVLGQLRSGRTWQQIAAQLQGQIEVSAVDAGQHSLELRPAQLSVPQIDVARIQRNIDAPWQLSSYSALMRASDRDSMLDQHASAATMAVDRDRSIAAEDPTPGNLEEGGIRWRFPAGPVAGECLHAILERLDFSLDANARRQAVRSQLMRFGFAASLCDEVDDWLQQIAAVSLTQQGATLAQVFASGGCAREWGFDIRQSQLRADVLSQRLAQVGAGSVQESPLKASLAQGFLTGFVDLVFEWQGRYWVLDYKSNRLGPEASHYQAAELHAAIREHRYDVQAVVYLCALHLHLSRTLAAYDPAHHLGGAVFAFLRGMYPQADAGVWRYEPTAAQLGVLTHLLDPEPDFAGHA
jgi:exodeoxyribonuclease V beta subunit